MKNRLLKPESPAVPVRVHLATDVLTRGIGSCLGIAARTGSPFALDLARQMQRHLGVLTLPPPAANPFAGVESAGEK